MNQIRYPYESIPIRGISAFNGQARSVAVVLKAYFDGSCNCFDPSCRFLTLAALHGDDSEWSPLERRWDGVLEKHGAPYSHMKKLLRGTGPFALWDDNRKCDFVRDLFLCLNSPSLDDNSVSASCLTVDLAEYRSIEGADGSNPNIKPAAAVCVDYCMTGCFVHPAFRRGRAELFFDKNEDFLKYAEYVWTRQKRNASSLASYVSVLAPVDMTEVLPIQMADLFAWSANRHYSQESQDFWATLQIRTGFSLPSTNDCFKRADLLKHPGFFAWRIKTPQNVQSSER